MPWMRPRSRTDFATAGHAADEQMAGGGLGEVGDDGGAIDGLTHDEAYGATAQPVCLLCN